MIARQIKNLDTIIYIIVQCNYSQIGEVHLATITQRYQGGPTNCGTCEEPGHLGLRIFQGIFFPFWTQQAIMVHGWFSSEL